MKRRWLSIMVLALVLLPAAAITGDGRTAMVDWKAFAVSDLEARLAESDKSYLEFLEVPSMDIGLYRLAAGAADPQQPHDRDEVYYVIAGRAVLTVGQESTPVRPGSVVFVRAGLPHRFEKIEEDLETLVFFSSGPTQ